MLVSHVLYSVLQVTAKRLGEGKSIPRRSEGAKA